MERRLNVERELLNLEEVQKALEDEQREWEKIGISIEQVVLGPTPYIMLDLSTRIQAMANLLIRSELVTEEDLNLEYKNIMLVNLRELRESVPEQQRAAIRAQLLSATNGRLGNLGKPPWER
jgi:hypothetical protein